MLTDSRAVKRDVNQLLQAYFDAQVARAAAVDPAYAALWEAMSELTMHGGKRLRPYLAVLAYQACGGSDYRRILRPAAAQELLHASLLMHDDIMDRDYMRYGRDNIAGVFRKKYASYISDAATVDHHAAGAALLAGDLMLAAAHQFTAESDFDQAKKRGAMQVLETGMFEVVGGQLLDTQAAILPVGQADSLKIARYKTASYSFMGPLGVGAVMAGASPKTVTGLQLFGRHAGIAYQLADDMLGLFSTEAETGKPAVSDLREGKRTYLLQQTMLLATPRDQKIIAAALGNPQATAGDLATVRDIVAACGAKTRAQDQIAACAQAAFAALDGLKVHPDARARLEQFAHSWLRI